MVVGARQTKDQASVARSFANSIYNRLASWMTGYQIDDLTSGFRAVRRDKFRRFLYLLPNKFSYPTTSTMAFFRSGYSVGYVPIRVQPRGGTSHISHWRDGVRFLIIILKIGALFSPMRLFLPISSSLLVTGICYYAYTYTVAGRFTNMSALLLIAVHPHLSDRHRVRTDLGAALQGQRNERPGKLAPLCRPRTNRRAALRRGCRAITITNTMKSATILVNRARIASDRAISAGIYGNSRTPSAASRTPRPAGAKAANIPARCAAVRMPIADAQLIPLSGATRRTRAKKPSPAQACGTQ